MPPPASGRRTDRTSASTSGRMSLGGGPAGGTDDEQGAEQGTAGEERSVAGSEQSAHDMGDEQTDEDDHPDRADDRADGHADGEHHHRGEHGDAAPGPIPRRGGSAIGLRNTP